MTDPHAWTWGLAAVLGPIALYGLHRLALRLEEAGHLYYLKRSPKGGGASCFVALQAVVEPGTRHVLVVPAESPDDEGDAGGPGRPRPGGRPPSPGRSTPGARSMSTR